MAINGKRGALLAGAAKVDITPADVVGLTNLWGFPFAGVHDRIFLRALLVENGINRALIVAADLVEFGDTLEIRQAIETEFGIPVANIVITASHDHNAPRAGVVTPGATAKKGGPATSRYTAWVYESILAVVRQAKAALQPARVGVGRGMADVNTNRNVFTPQGWKLGANPDRPSDKSVWVVKFESASRQPIAIVMNYAAHSVILGSDNDLVTGDLAGAVERYVEEHYDEKVVALWTMGPAGDQNPKFISFEADASDRCDKVLGYRLMETQGQLLGEEVVRVAEGISQMDSLARIAAEEKKLSLPARIPPRDGKGGPMQVEPVDALNIRLGLIMIDQIALTWVSGEVVTNIYWRLRRESPFTNTLMITIANDRIGYIVDDAGYDSLTFETLATPLQPGFAESAIIDGLVEMMSQY